MKNENIYLKQLKEHKRSMLYELQYMEYPDWLYKYIKIFVAKLTRVSDFELMDYDREKVRARSMFIFIYHQCHKVSYRKMSQIFEKKGMKIHYQQIGHEIRELTINLSKKPDEHQQIFAIIKTIRPTHPFVQKE